MRYFCIDEWRDNLHIRKSKQDACVPIREFTYQAYRWIWDYRPPIYPASGQNNQPHVGTLCGPLREDLEDAKDLFQNHFIILGDGVTQKFIQQGENVAKHLLNNHIHCAWRWFCNSVQQKGDSGAFASILVAMDNLELYFSEPGRDSYLLRTFEEKVSIPWPSVRDRLAQGYMFIPVREIESLWCELAKFVQDARENYDLPQSGGRWWSDVVEGQFRPFTAFEAVSELADGKTADLQNADLAANIAAHISDLRKGRIPEDRLLEVLIYILKAANELAQAQDAQNLLRKVSPQQSGQKQQKTNTRILSDLGSKANKRMAGLTMRWIADVASILPHMSPAMTKADIAEWIEEWLAMWFKASQQKREEAVAKIPNQDAQKLLRQTPTRPLKAETIKKKLSKKELPAVSEPGLS